MSVADTIKLKPEGEVVRLQNVIASAIEAMDNGLYGDARRIMRTGTAEPMKAGTGVLAGNGGAA